MQFLDFTLISNNSGFPYCPITGHGMEVGNKANECYYLYIGTVVPSNLTRWRSGRLGSMEMEDTLNQEWVAFMESRIIPEYPTLEMVTEFLDSSSLSRVESIWDNTVMIRYSHKMSESEVLSEFYSIMYINADSKP